MPYLACYQCSSTYSCPFLILILIWLLKLVMWTSSFLVPPLVSDCHQITLAPLCHYRQVSLAGQRKCRPWMVLRFDSSKWPVDPLSMWPGYRLLRHLIICQHSAAKVTILMVMSVRDPDMPYSDMNPEVAICLWPIVKVTIIMVMSSGNPDVMSCLYDQVSCWKSLAMGVSGYPSYPVPMMMVCPNKLDDGLYVHRVYLGESLSCI